MQRASIAALLHEIDRLSPAGFAVAMHIRFTRPTYLFQTYAKRWMDHYSAKGMVVHDPLVHWGLQNVGRIRWSELEAIDKLSTNSDHETKSQSEAAFQQSFAKQFGDIGLIVTLIMSAVFFTLLLLTGNTMAQAVRERIPELAVLKTIGFSNHSVLFLVLAEAILLIGIGGLIGLGLAAALMPGVSAASGGVIQLPGVPSQTWIFGLALMALIGVLVGLLPALRAMRLNIVDALAGR